jgi:hypothetical protein
MKQSPWEVGAHSTGKEIVRLLWKPNTHYRVYKSLWPTAVLTQFKSFNMGTPYSFSNILIVNSQRTSKSFKYLPSFLPSPSGWPLASWTICLHSSLFRGRLVSEQFSSYGVRLLASRPTPNLEDQDIPLRLAPTPWPARRGWSYQ